MPAIHARHKNPGGDRPSHKLTDSSIWQSPAQQSPPARQRPARKRRPPYSARATLPVCWQKLSCTHEEGCQLAKPATPDDAVALEARENEPPGRTHQALQPIGRKMPAEKEGRIYPQEHTVSLWL